MSKNKDDFKKDIDFEQFEKEQAQYEISMYDLVRSPTYQKWLKEEKKTIEDVEKHKPEGDDSVIRINYPRPDFRTMSAFLYGLGMDIEDEVEEQWNTHRTWEGKVVTTTRFVGQKRTDERWLKMMRGVNQ